MEKHGNRSQIFIIVAFTILTATVVVTTGKTLNMILSQQETIEKMNQRIAKLEQGSLTKNIDSDLGADEVSSLSTNEVTSYVLTGIKSAGMIFLTEDEANNFVKKYEGAVNVDYVEVRPVEAMLTLLNGDEEVGVVYSAIVHTNDE